MREISARKMNLKLIHESWKVSGNHSPQTSPKINMSESQTAMFTEAVVDEIYRDPSESYNQRLITTQS
jgi:hypothetical protein